DSAREERANWDIGHEMMTHAVEEGLPSTVLLAFIVYGRTCSLRLAVCIGDRKILLCFVSADAIHPKRRARRQSTDFLVSRKWFGNTAEQPESNPASGLRISGDFPTC